MKKLITILLLLFSTIVIAQNNPFQYKIWVGEDQYNYLETHYVDGAVNLLNGKKIGGLINRDFTKPIITLIDGDTVTYDGREIIDFKLKDQSKVISATIDGEQKFLQELPIEEGPIKIYTYDKIIKEDKRDTGGKYFTSPIEYNRIVKIYFYKNGEYKILTSNNDVYQLIYDNQITMDYIKKLGEIELSNLNQIVHIIEFYNISN